MSTETRRRHTREFVETLIGPVVYIIYFVLAYSATTVACSLAQGSVPTIADGPAVARNATFGLTLVALAAISIVSLLAMRRLSPFGRKAEDNQDLFMAILTLALALLSALAVLWTGVATMLVPACA